MSVFKTCPHNGEECIHEIYLGEPRYNLCKTCSVFTSKDEVKEDPQVGHKSDSEEIVELKKEVEDKGIKYADSLEYTISKFSDTEGYCWSQVEQAYEQGALDFAEPREKQITELKQKLKQAEEIIRKYYNYNPSCEYSYEDIDKLAEQFLKEKT